jgi:DNA ligase (NAD+)
VVERINERGRKRASHFKMPSKCPSCGTKAVERGPYTVCPNHFGCPAQLKGLIVHFTSKEALDIENLGAETVATLIDRKLVKSLEDLFHLGANDFLQLEGFAERSAHQLFDAIQKSKRVELRRFLYGLGIPEVGAAVARDLADHFKSLDAVRHAGRQDFEEVSGIGPKMSESIHDFFEEKRRQQVIDGLLKAGVHVVEPAKRGKQPLSGKKFVFTGSLDQLTRSEAEKLVESLGARATSSVSGDTDYVVAGKDPGQKLDSAKEHGVNILNEKEFVNLVRGKGAQVRLHRG